MPVITLSHSDKTVRFGNASSDHPLVYRFFGDLPENRREEELNRALVIGVMALMEDRIASFLARTENELGTHLEALKLLYDRRRLVEARAVAGGVVGEQEVHNRLIDYLQKAGQPGDNLRATGMTVGAMRNNRTGDIVVEFEGDPKRAVTIEVKFDKSLSLGAWEDGDSTSRTRDTALSQLFESNANRKSQYAVIVFDKSRCAPALMSTVGNIKWMPGAGFVVIIDHDRADYSHLYLAVDLLRTMTRPGIALFDDSVLEALLGRMSQDLATILQTKELLRENNQNLRKIAASIEKHAALVEFTRELIQQGLTEGRLDARLLLEIYRGEKVLTHLKPRLGDIEALLPDLPAQTEPETPADEPPRRKKGARRMSPKEGIIEP